MVCSDTAVLLGDDGALKDLDSLAGAFLDLYMNANGIADVHLGQLSLHILLIQFFNQIHK